MWVRVPLPVNIRMDFRPVEYLQRMQLFFLKRGKKASLESLLRSWLVRRARQGKTSVYSLLHNCILYGTPFVSLKTRRRGKRVFYKVGYMERERGERKSLGALRQTLKDQNYERFTDALEKEIESLASGKSRIVEKRDELHRLALEASPSGWLTAGRRRRRVDQASSASSQR
jgi:ribosomal protein S7